MLWIPSGRYRHSRHFPYRTDFWRLMDFCMKKREYIWWKYFSLLWAEACQENLLGKHQPDSRKIITWQKCAERDVTKTFLSHSQQFEIDLKWDKSKEITFFLSRFSALNIWGRNGPSFIEMCVQWINNNIRICNLHLCIKCLVLWKWVLCCTWTNYFHTPETVIHTRNLITHMHSNYANHLKPWFLKILYLFLLRWMLFREVVFF